MEYFIVGVPQGTLASSIAHCIEHGWSVDDYDTPSLSKKASKPRKKSGSGRTPGDQVMRVMIPENEARLPDEGTQLRKYVDSVMSKYNKGTVSYDKLMALSAQHTQRSRANGGGCLAAELKKRNWVKEAA